MQKSTKQTIKIYWQQARHYKLAFFSIIFTVIIASALSVVSPLYVRNFINILTGETDKNQAVGQALSILLIILTIEIIQWAFYRVATFIETWFSIRMENDLYNTCFKFLHKHSFSFFNNNFVGSLVKRVHRFANSFLSIRDNLIWSFLPLIVNVIFITIVLSTKNIFLGLVLILWTILFISVSVIFARYKLKYDVKISEADSAISGIMSDTITNHTNVKLFCGYGKEVAGFQNSTNYASGLYKVSWNLNNYFEAVQGFLAMALELGVMYVGLLLWKKGQFSIGDFVLLQSYVVLMFNRIWDIGRVIRKTYQNLSEAQEMTEIFNTPLEITDKLKAKQLVVSEGKIDFINVTFSYNQTRTIFKKFNLSIKPQEKVAFVGPSGAGKSTIVKLILRMHDIDSGKILIDGQKISDVTQESLWAAASMVPQDPILFHRSLLDNIRYGKFDATDDEVYRAAKLAHCHEFISGLSDGYNTFVGERGVKLSGGERQRVAIARAILRDAPILILDEATSSLDSESESFIQDSFDILMKNKTVIAVAHRLSTVMKMDRIIVIDEGGITEEGTHAQLLAKQDGLYKKLWQLQAGGFIS